MSKRTLVEELDQAVESLLRNPGAPLPPVDAQIAPLVQLAAELRDLPNAGFQSRLLRDLLPVGPEGELVARDLLAALKGLPDRSELVLARLNQSNIGVSRCSEEPMWERHAEGDELLHVLEGELEVTTLTESGPVQTTVPAGSLFVCPRGLWHRPRPRPTASLLFVTPRHGTETSRAKDPRRSRAGKPSRRTRGRAVGSSGGSLIAHDFREALRGVPELVLTADTTGEEAGAAFRGLGSLDKAGLYVGRFSGLSPWERHSAADELLHILDGEVEITVLTDAGPVINNARAGSVFVCPRGLWHRQYAPAGVTALSATPQPTEVSFAEDPRL